MSYSVISVIVMFMFDYCFICSQLRIKSMNMNIFKKLTGGVNFKVSGEVVEGYEAVWEMFEQYFREGSESRAQVCVYACGERVVDLHGSIYEDDEFGPDSLIPVFSCSKVNISNLFVGEAFKI